MDRGLRQRFRLAPAAYKRYAPGDLSGVYQKLPPGPRRQVDQDVDRLFVLKTAIKRKLDPANPRDKAYMRQWLLIRDTVIAIRRFNEIADQDRQQRNLQAQVEAEWHTAQIGQYVAGQAPSLEIKGDLLGKVVHGSHQFIEAVEWSEIFIDVWPHFLEGAAEVVEVAGPWLTIVGLPLGVIANLHDIAEAHEAGERAAHRSAFMHGFASQLVNGRIVNALPEGTEVGHYQRLGDKAARLYLSQLNVEVRNVFLARYRGPQRYPGENMDHALRHLGYLGRRARH